MLRGRYRLFQATSVYNKEKGRSDKVTKYLGWFTDDGMFIPAEHRDERTKELKEMEKENRERLSALQDSQKEAETKIVDEGIRKRETERHERDILRALSMDARKTIPELVKITGIKETTVAYHLRNLERRYDMEYVLEIDIEKFGYVDYVAFGKFLNKKPVLNQMKEELEKYPYVQAAMITKGEYDIVVLLVAESNSNARGALYDFTREVLSSYDIEWTMSPAYFSGLGFIPLRKEFFEVLKEKVWKRTREKPRPEHDQITEVEYNVLMAMNKNAAADFASIDREIHTERGRSNYAYHRLIDRGIIKRATVNMRNLSSRFDALFILNIINIDSWLKGRERFMLDLIKENDLQVDTYSFACDIMSPKGVLLMAHVFKDQNPEAIAERLIKDTGGARIYEIVVTDIIVGSVNSRFSDKIKTRQYEILVSHYNYNPEKLKEMINGNR
ncbi:MAG: winged helix-turn-helix transcriptional regulator [Candidatus Marsarchaeota archaeon]|jgi:DNA-binding Lrp family transcriptional regulator|nr:winged helix-turn-helix transcriptional regulator [Candidatus Marsarchaeota archaeon]